MPTVLIVDDEKNIRQFVAVNLRARGYAILLAESAEEGLQILRDHRPQAMILDIKLPGISGWSMLREIDSDPTLPQLPVVVMTASSVINQPGEYHYPQLIEKLTKPVAVTDLIAVIQKIFA